MNQSVTIIRSLLIYGICLPLAIYFGYLLATPNNVDTVMTVGVVLGVMVLPLVLSWYHELLLVFWNASMVVFFLPGQPPVWMAVGALACAVAVFKRALNRGEKFLSAWLVTWPVLFLLAVVLVTAKLTGGLSMRLGGGSAYGGKKYYYIIATVIGYFALISKPIPRAKAGRYSALFFLSQVTAAITVLVVFVPTWLYGIFWVFPVDSFAVESMVSDATMISGEPLKRLGGLAIAGQAICCGICAVIGLRGLLTARGFGYGILVLAAFVLSLFAGFRTNVVYLAVLFCLLFWLEGLARTRWLPILAGIIIVAFLAVLPIVDRLPLSFQRSLSFLPVNISPVVAADARASTEWRLAIWRQMWPEVPRYLWLGKGFTFNGRDLEFAELKQQLGNGEQGEVSRLSGDYHSGPLSLLIPFGLPGMLSFIWLLLAGLRALHRNRIYGDAGLRTINNFLFTIFLLRAFFYFVVYGSLYTDLPVLLGVLGLSISLNGGICSPQKKLASQPPTTFRPRIS